MIKPHKDLPQILHIKYLSNWPIGFRGEIFTATLKQESFMAAMCFIMRKPHKGTFIDVPHQILIYWSSGFTGEEFLMYQPIRRKDPSWRPSFLFDLIKMRKVLKNPPMMLHIKYSSI